MSAELDFARDPAGWIRAGILRNDLTQAEIAKAAEVHQSELSRMLAGKRRLRTGVANRIKVYIDHAENGRQLFRPRRLGRKKKAYETDLGSIQVFGRTDAGMAAISSLATPAEVAGVEGAYGVLVPPDILVVDPHKPVSAGATVVHVGKDGVSVGVLSGAGEVTFGSGRIQVGEGVSHAVVARIPSDRIESPPESP